MPKNVKLYLPDDKEKPFTIYKFVCMKSNDASTESESEEKNVV